MYPNIDNNSSCLVQHQWNWSSNANSNQWTRPMQYYRVRNPYYPGEGSVSDAFYVVETRNKVRGHGKVLSIMFNTEPGQHCTIHGWSTNLGTDGNV